MERRWVIKVGSALLTEESGLLRLPFIQQLVEQIVSLKREGISPLLVSSGAVAAGKGALSLQKKKSCIQTKQVFSAVGQVVLMEQYRRNFSHLRESCAQILVTKEDFRGRDHYLHVRDCLEALLHYGVIPVLNENDAISIEGLMFTDNDELAGWVASMMCVEKLVLLTNVPGLLNAKGECIKEVLPDLPLKEECSFLQNSSQGRGGMHTKYSVGVKMARLGIQTHICHGLKEGILLKLLCNEEKVGTRFIPRRELSSIKRWMAHEGGKQEAAVRIDRGAERALLSREFAHSLLPVGIREVVGSFKGGDLIMIQNDREESFALGKARYSAEKLRTYLGQKGAPLFVHYDYLYFLEGK